MHKCRLIVFQFKLAGPVTSMHSILLDTKISKGWLHNWSGARCFTTQDALTNRCQSSWNIFFLDKGVPPDKGVEGHVDMLPYDAHKGRDAMPSHVHHTLGRKEGGGALEGGGGG